MRKDVNKHRRQVAWICFEPHLTESQLLQAIEILEHGYQTDSVNSLIAYVSRICGDYGIGAEIRKSLYGKFHDLMSREVDDLIDPWTLVEAGRQAQTVPFDAKRASGPESPRPPPPPADVEMPLVPDQPPPEPALPAVTVVFVGFVERIVEHVSDQAEFFELLKASSKQRPKEMRRPIDLWSANPVGFEWARGLKEPALAEILQLVYAALCELIGPVEADHAFHKAIAKCEQLSEARLFPPNRFL